MFTCPTTSCEALCINWGGFSKAPETGRWRQKTKPITNYNSGRIIATFYRPPLPRRRTKGEKLVAFLENSFERCFGTLNALSSFQATRVSQNTLLFILRTQLRSDRVNSWASKMSHTYAVQIAGQQKWWPFAIRCVLQHCRTPIRGILEWILAV